MKQGILYYRGKKGFLSKLISLVQYSRGYLFSNITHVEFVYDFDPIVNGYRTLSSSAWDGGVRPTIIRPSAGKWIFLPLPDDKFVSDEEIKKWLKLNHNKPYAYLDAFAFARTTAPTINKDKSQYYCTEVVAQICKLNCNGVAPAIMYRKHMEGEL